ncbi:hypothetical protein TSAR_016441 [Trichomalopsis sarcophagae]|uniref:Uncharacterized protein n=1 Tax=Trichomalopsis sarcophagae TaxID=543379 RepID=A0A232EIF8_9HYME|nr:hypothetical protein TSAR_016441 [Trichomalopsis sarcophagae]
MQLQSIFYKRLRNSDNFEDFTDGVLYKEFIQSLLQNKIMNSLTATYNKPITCRIWFGKDKPDMNIFLKHYVVYMNKLADEGIEFKINGVNNNRYYIHVVCCCVDSVARSPMVGMVQYNGYFGCHWCLHPGVYIRSSRGGCVKYVLLNEAPLNRTERETLQNMQLSIRSVNPVFGIKKPSILVNLRSFNVISGFVPDSMHCICLGIAEQFAKYWFDTSNIPFSLSNEEINIIDDLVLKIKAPNQIARLSRSMKERSWLKAREFENWILYYSLPILITIPHMLICVQHWSLLVEVFHILNRDKIRKNQITHADKLLKKLVAYTELYYSQAAMTYNVHQLLHIAQSVTN